MQSKESTLHSHISLSIDEQMISFTGNFSLRKCVKNKSKPVRLKNSVLATPPGIGKPESVNHGSTIFLDTYFRFCPLCGHLKEEEIHTIGTIMMKKIPAPAKNKMRSDKDQMKMGRDTFQENWTTCNHILPKMYYGINMAIRGITLNDRMISYYRMSQRTKIGPFVLFSIELISQLLILG
ncbi:hypothetical protein NQ314_018332 [Rhamnusium bicolor]|uniref:Uncharacterized protein n=1 Tax=Rhamnusium bicolor TaxID=1586634 RepID=A0AAV8WTC9_9CUCU|nr:hypothetical protein NQ314_018332 [Rhamnusium bicolor]